MTSNINTIVFTGLGGQGLISLLKILGNALVNKGYKVTTSETHGLSQRGGKVTCFLRYGGKVSAPLPMIGTADIIVAIEKSCVLDVLKYAKPSRTTNLIISNYEKQMIDKVYPAEKELLSALCENSDNIHFIPTKELTKNSKTGNTVILGFLLRFLPLSEVDLENSLRQQFSERNLEKNLKAFREGLNLG